VLWEAAIFGGKMKGLIWVGVAYFGIVGVFTFVSATSPGTTPTADQIAALPSLGTLFGGGQGATTTGAVLDLAAAAGLWYFAIR
jgi:hypothetical protein